MLTTSEPSSGTDVSRRTITLTVGLRKIAPELHGHHGRRRRRRCIITEVNQTSGTTAISASFSGDNYYHSSTAASTATVHTPTTLTVNAGTSDFADAGTVSGMLTELGDRHAIPGEPVTLTLNGTQTCSATTTTIGLASCSITPNEPAATYAVTASFVGDTTKTPQLLSSTGPTSSS